MAKKKKKKNRSRPKNQYRIRKDGSRICAEEEYLRNEAEAIEKFIEDTYGPIEGVVHDLDYNKLHVDINIVAPTYEQPYWKLVTSGMGAHKMKVPEKYKSIVPERCELILAVEPFWKYEDDIIFDLEDKGFEVDVTYKSAWPIIALRTLAFLPVTDQTLIRPLLTIDLSHINYDIETQLKEILTLWPQDIDTDKNTVFLPNGEPVAFYQVVPITSKERRAIHMASDPSEVIRHLPYTWVYDRNSAV